ncbi:AbrB/MazE/SpoVT family DNA-binding domain-containing protein [Micromonospora qiuiae]|uniref:AbrB/MazE/SpoVT family DNA-binding domain-containing protein n=1 Tax=Micromonospora qiuiae TaxID=502268 RepID=UPI001EF3BBFC|nr:AbrB/MazE/SpoVT family DNA-binding domain-containing protein [Micromonospora qiuiae]
MTARVVAAVIPPSTHASAEAEPISGRRALPVAPLTPEPQPAAIYGMAAIDRDGRLSEAVVIPVLGWLPGTRVDIRVCGGLVLVTADPHAAFRVTRPGQVRLPATVRHWCGLTAGVRVLLVADPDAGRLVVHPPAAVQAMIIGWHANVLGGEAG